jgi:hypothetical protein
MKLPAIGDRVIYRSRTGDYDVPAIVNCTVDTINPEGVELGHVPALSGDYCVHLTVLTPGKPGMRREATDFKTESPHGRSENVAGTYQEWDVAYNHDGNDEPAPGSWRWSGALEQLVEQALANEPLPDTWVALDIPAHAAGTAVLLVVNEAGEVRAFTGDRARELYDEGLLTGWVPGAAADEQAWHGDAGLEQARQTQPEGE